MIKIGIIDADSKISGEIIRILLHHPEADIRILLAPGLIGRNVTSIHHGLIGEQQMLFSDKLPLEDIDFLIITKNTLLAHTILEHIPDNSEIKIVTLPEIFDKENSEIGLSEINRKSLVRGATRAFIPSSIEVSSLIALCPLARFLLLNSEIAIEIELPKTFRDSFSGHENEIANKIKKQIQKIQSSFSGNIVLHLNFDSDSSRSSHTRISLKNTLSPEEIEKIYDEIYDDHNFTFVARGEIEGKEVEGTQKTVISFNKPTAEDLVIDLISDPIMRGGAGDVVHVMNLLFGLYEKTGLHLKSSSY